MKRTILSIGLFVMLAALSAAAQSSGAGSSAGTGTSGSGTGSSGTTGSSGNDQTGSSQSGTITPGTGINNGTSVTTPAINSGVNARSQAGIGLQSTNQFGISTNGFGANTNTFGLSTNALGRGTNQMSPTGRTNSSSRIFGSTNSSSVNRPDSTSPK